MLSLPAPLHAFFSLFPLHTYPPILPPTYKPLISPTLWIHPPAAPNSPLSADVECLKWQAYLALRGLSALRTRTDVSSAGAIAGRLPNLHTSPTELLAAHLIPTWADAQVPPTQTLLEGYRDEAARDESRAWIALLEGNVHAALILSTPPPSYLFSLLSLEPAPLHHPLQSIVLPPPAPLTGFASLFPASGTRISHAAVYAQYRDAISALSVRLGTDKWFLGSGEPTPLDALAFAYLHSIITSEVPALRVEVNRRVNLVAWERRVRELVCAAFII